MDTDEAVKQVTKEFITPCTVHENGREITWNVLWRYEGINSNRQHMLSIAYHPSNLEPVRVTSRNSLHDQLKTLWNRIGTSLTQAPCSKNQFLEKVLVCMPGEYIDLIKLQ